MPKAVVIPDWSKVTFEDDGLVSVGWSKDVVVVEVRSDDPRTRYRFHFHDVQAVRVTTSDCFDYTSVLIDNRLSRHLVEVLASSWLKALTAEIHEHDGSPSVMEKSRHFALAFDDQVVEVAAWSVEAIPVRLRYSAGQWIE